MSPDATAERREQVLDWIRSGERFLLITHENADGDALGSLVAMHSVLTALGKDSAMFMAPDEFPLPYEYRFFRLDGMVSSVPDDVAERKVIFLDCGNIDRNPAHGLFGDADLLNIDHHHDNTRFGRLNYVVPDASCTAELVWDLMHGLGVTPTPPVAEALYVGLITDTGRFMYENTGPRAHQMAAELIAVGVDVQAIYRRLYEDMPLAKLELLARALRNVSRHDDGARDLRLHHGGRLRRDRRRGELFRGHHRQPACRARYQGRRTQPGADAARIAAPSARSRCAPSTTTSTSRPSRAPRAGTGTAGPPASPPTWRSTSSSRSCAAPWPSSSGRPPGRPRRRLPERATPWTACCSSTSRRA